MNFTQATEYCRSIDAFLAEPKTLDEYDRFLDYFICLGINHGMWLGATDSASEGTWVWQSV